MSFNQLGKRTLLEQKDGTLLLRFPAINAPVATAATIVLDTSFQANWNAVSNAMTYGLTVARDANFADIVTGYNRLEVNDVTFPVTGLAALTSYWYRVEAWNGRSSVYSNVVTLTTAALPVTSGLVLALTASSLIGLFNDGDNVTSWTSIEGKVFTKPAYVAGYPVFKTNIVNGKPVVRHVGSVSIHKRLNCNHADFFQANPTLFAVMAWKTATAGLFRRGPGIRPAANIGYGFDRSFNGTADEYTTALAGVNNVATHVGAHGTGQAEPAREANGIFFVAELARVAGSGWGLWINGVQTGGFAADQNLTLATGANPFSTSAYFDTGTAVTDGLTREDHDLAKVALYNRNLTNAERNSVRATLGAEFAIAVVAL